MTRETTLTIPDIHCGGCANTITRHMQGVSGVSVTDVDTASRVISLRFDENAVSLHQIREALDEIGFSPED